MIGLRMPLALVALLASAAAAGPAETVSADASPVETRQRLMVSMIRATKVPRAMVRGDRDFDAEAIDAAMTQVIEAGRQMPDLFADPGAAGPTATLPAAWDNPAEFTAAFATLEREALGLADAARQGPEAMALAYQRYEAVCDGCHMRYRKDE